MDLHPASSKAFSICSLLASGFAYSKFSDGARKHHGFLSDIRKTLAQKREIHGVVFMLADPDLARRGFIHAKDKTHGCALPAATVANNAGELVGRKDDAELLQNGNAWP